MVSVNGWQMKAAKLTMQIVGLFSQAICQTRPINHKQLNCSIIMYLLAEKNHKEAVAAGGRLGLTSTLFAALNDVDDQHKNHHNQRKSDNPQKPSGGKALHAEALGRPQRAKKKAPDIHNGPDHLDDVAEEAWVLEVEDL